MSNYTEHNEDGNIDDLLGNPKYGTYLDIGSHNPYSASVSRLFYERGWRGCNVEPLKRYYDSMLQAHPEDITLNVAIGKESGTLILFDGDGLTSSRKEYAHSDWAQIEVPMMTLKQVCDIYFSNKDISWLKLDLEGGERDAILGADWSRYRPYVLCVEAARPMDNTVDVSGEWESLLFEAEYNFVKWDDDHWNKYYIRKEGW